MVHDVSYVHTDNNYTTEEKNKLAELNNYDDTDIKADIAKKADKLKSIQYYRKRNSNSTSHICIFDRFII